MRDEQLWKRIEAFDFNKGKVWFNFTNRLAARKSWDSAFTKRAIFEYRRFMYLIAVRGEMTPSKVVDEVWHLHLEDSDNYNNQFCLQVIGKVIHHNPSSGSTEEDARHAVIYLRTLANYEEEFGQRPPWRFWPDPNRKPKLPKMPSKAAKIFACIFGVCGSVAALSSFIYGAIPFTIGSIFMAIVLPMSLLMPRVDGVNTGTGGGCSGSCSGGGHGGCSGGGCSGSCGGGCGGGH